MGVMTGIVQESQFGLNWSEYSRFIGGVFGAPLAMEGLLAFLLESTFLVLWIFAFGLFHPGCELMHIGGWYATTWKSQESQLHMLSTINQLPIGIAARQ